ncbi:MULTISPECIES: DUF2924 domain-containing protein [unclassified Sphingopyxis]|uniref:DUF2924 domain-containing protein n=1 Tax=unclassified Sphingopyxis TaxID=2614943 RepID=UPI00286008EA|nr:MULTISPECIES: DUF2924 domain-containing protein [unclassified Sphingopyxis]MDR6832602.1 hypothetical protein [Sphingopyxis sp. BE122]MDR7228345.1 hypothetical protein [Sphingopyxis sp. BE259]
MTAKISIASVEAIADMSAEQIVAEWERAHGVPAPVIAPSLLARDLAHCVQVALAGGIDKRLERRLLELAASVGGDSATLVGCRKSLGHGTQILREWGGQTHRVTVEAEGRYRYDGQTWSSLSAIARAITGARWSGPRFFGTRS